MMVYIDLIGSERFHSDPEVLRRCKMAVNGAQIGGSSGILRGEIRNHIIFASLAMLWHF